MRRTLWSLTFLATLFLVAIAHPEPARGADLKTEEARFYEGKTIRLIVGMPPGGFFDMWSRLLGRHMGRYVPGNPRILVQNMPGAGSKVAANYLYNAAKPDGLTFGIVSGAIHLDELTGSPGVRFRWPKFTFIGRPAKDSALLFIRSDLPYKNWRDVRAATEPIPVGATITGSTSTNLASAMRDILGLNLNIILGYRGGAAIDAAIERGEVAARALAIGIYVGREPFLTWHEKGFVRAIAQTGRERDARLDPGVPTVWEIAEELHLPEADLEFMETVVGVYDWLWIYVAPPGLPVERARILRDAFNSTLADSRLLEEGARIGLFPDAEPIHPEELQQLAAKVMDVDRNTVKRLKRLMGY